MISGYLGHAFSVSFLRENFPGSIFVYLKRDELSNVYSMIKTYNEFKEHRKEFNWMSLKPIGWEGKLEEDVVDKVLWQYKSIKQNIESEISEEDTIIVNYEDICNNPHNFLKKIKEFANEHEIDLKLYLENIPDTLHLSKINRDKDEIAKQISQLLNEK